ncbi:MAG: hypothetical protein RBQ71_07555 [Acholeplasmataceae bacterium]|nr:hypothetical protein [Acholeplasmataceae bacterium]
MKQLSKVDFRIANFIIGLIAVFMIFLPTLILKDSETSFSGLEIALGKEFASLGSLASGEIAFNPIVLLAFVLPLIGALIPFFTGKVNFISTCVYAVAAILIFAIPEFTTVTVTILGNVNEVDVEWTYGIGLIFAASLSILGVILGSYNLYVSQKTK